MNEKIKLLWDTAVTLVEQEPDGDWSLDACKEKFAELIVAECIDIISPYTVRMSKPGEEYLHPIQEIKQHFGVEE